MKNELKIKNVNLTQLKEYKNNPRYIDDEAIEKVAKSIKEFGFKVPIIVDGDSIIVAGHTRKKAAERLGLNKVPVIVADDLNEEQIKAFRLADNKVAEFSEWDFELLSTELDDLDMNMDDFGFDEIEEDDVEQKEDTSSVDLDENVVIVVEADTEDKLEEIFTELVEEGYQCRLLTL